MNVDSTTSTPRRRVDLSDDALIDPLAIERDQARALLSQTPINTVGLVVVGFLFWVFYAPNGGWPVWLWLDALLFMQLINLILWRQFKKVSGADTLGNRTTQQWNPHPWLKQATIRSTIVGGVLGVGVWLFFTPKYGGAAYLAPMTVCVIAAVWIASSPYHRPTMFGFLFGIAVPTIHRTWTIDGDYWWLVGGIFTFYLVAIGLYGWRQSKFTLESLRMRYRNDALVAQLNTHAAALEASDQARSRFFAAASHDLRQPLHALSYYLSLLKPNEHDQPHVERIEQCVGALDDLLEGVLDIARLDAGRVQPQRRVVDLNSQLTKLAGLYGGAAAAKGLKLTIRLPRPRSATNTDEQLLERVLANLINNAIRYTHAGGILLAIRPRGAQWGIAVIDTGVGIAQESLHSVFDEFVQLGNQERNTTQGVGLGLATVKRICALLNHQIIVRSTLQHGSWFEVRVPRADPAAIRSAVLVADHTGELQGRILLIEDNELVSESLSKVLVSWNLSCDVAANGEQALRLAHANQYDAVLCDWRLPGAMDGCETLKHLERIQLQLKLRVLLTGERDDSIVGLPEGVPLLRKPIRPIRLRALLSAYLLAQ